MTARLHSLHLRCTCTKPSILNIVWLSQLERQVSLLVLVVTVIDSLLGWKGFVSDKTIGALADYLITFHAKDVLVLDLAFNGVRVPSGQRHMT